MSKQLNKDHVTQTAYNIETNTDLNYNQALVLVANAEGWDEDHIADAIRRSRSTVKRIERELFKIKSDSQQRIAELQKTVEAIEQYQE